MKGGDSDVEVIFYALLCHIILLLPYPHQNMKKRRIHMCKKILSFALAFVCLLSLATPASAAETKSAYDLEAYMCLTSQGLISFDAEKAVKDGFPADMVSRHQARITIMNNLVLDGVTTISVDYTARVYLGNTRSGDYTYIDYNAWGYTVYYSVSDTQEIVDNLPSDKKVASLQDIYKIFGETAYLASYGIVINISLIRQAASNGTGIYIQIYDDGTTATPLCFIGPR